MDDNELHELLKSMPGTDYIVRIEYRDGFYDDTNVINELLLYDGNKDQYIWENDWNEGYTDYSYTGIIEVDDVTEFINLDRKHINKVKELAYLYSKETLEEALKEKGE